MCNPLKSSVCIIHNIGSLYNPVSNVQTHTIWGCVCLWIYFSEEMHYQNTNYIWKGADYLSEKELHPWMYIRHRSRLLSAKRVAIVDLSQMMYPKMQEGVSHFSCREMWDNPFLLHTSVGWSLRECWNRHAVATGTC